MSPSSCLTAAGLLAFLLSSPAIAGGRSAPRAIPMMRQAPVVMKLSVPSVARPVAQARGISPRPAPFPGAQFAQLPRSIVMHGQVHDGRLRDGRHRAFTYLAGGAAAYYVGAPAYAADPAYVAQPRVEYVPVEAPLTASYGEPQLLASQYACAKPAVHYLDGRRPSGRMPEVIYGIQPNCAPSAPALAPISGGHVRAAY